MVELGYTDIIEEYYDSFRSYMMEINSMDGINLDAFFESMGYMQQFNNADKDVSGSLDKDEFLELIKELMKVEDFKNMIENDIGNTNIESWIKETLFTDCKIIGQITDTVSIFPFLTKLYKLKRNWGNKLIKLKEYDAYVSAYVDATRSVNHDYLDKDEFLELINKLMNDEEDFKNMIENDIGNTDIESWIKEILFNKWKKPINGINRFQFLSNLHILKMKWSSRVVTTPTLTPTFISNAAPVSNVGPLVPTFISNPIVGNVSPPTLTPTPAFFGNVTTN